MTIGDLMQEMQAAVLCSQSFETEVQSEQCLPTLPQSLSKLKTQLRSDRTGLKLIAPPLM